MEKFFVLIKDDLEKVEYEFKGLLISLVPRISEVAADLIMRGGKRFRPALLLLSSRICGYTGEDHIPLAAVIEFVHTASLLHDDVIDNAEIRRGRPAANREIGDKYSVLVGDFLYCRSLAIGIDIGNMKVLKILAAATTALTEGETMELEKAQDLTITEEENQELIINKTAVLISAAARIGAILGNASREAEEALAHYALEVGIAFQLIDDYLDYIGEEESLRKDTGRDLKEGKITLPLIHALSQCTPEERQQIQEIALSDEFPADGLQRIVGFIEKYDGFGYTLATAQRHIARGKERLSVFPSSPEREALFEGADYVVKRRV